MRLKPTDHVVLAGLAVTLTTAIMLPASAQVSPLSVTCQATIVPEPGITLTYRLTGIFPDHLPPNTPQNLVGRTTTMTVQRRDRQGQIQMLLNQAIVRDYEQVAPDADYSKLPFTGVFRGKPNDGFRLYGVSGVRHGLYASLRPTNGQPQTMQIVHYLSSGKFVRSTPGQCYSNAAMMPAIAPLQQALNG